jgi:hypothetical protein
VFSKIEFTFVKLSIYCLKSRYKLDESEFDIFLALHSKFLTCFLFAPKIYSFIHWTSTLDSHLQSYWCIKTWLDYRDVSMTKLLLKYVKYVVVTFHSISSCNCCIYLKKWLILQISLNFNKNKVLPKQWWRRNYCKKNIFK